MQNTCRFVQYDELEVAARRRLERARTSRRESDRDPEARVSDATDHATVRHPGQAAKKPRGPLGAMLPSLPHAESNSASAPLCVASSGPTKRARPFRDDAPDAGDPILDAAGPPKQPRQGKKQPRVRSEHKLSAMDIVHSAVSPRSTSATFAPVQTRLEAAGLPIARGAYTALNKPSPPMFDQTSLYKG
ncbi:hypothetical protein HYPSUDRAFT_56777 [Hypholoma sublateritium FD-334 SS-4]|uniref:Uncharacterized protein n=1 Tax=Hypholoma sublateritium (strain FD-334 SS-4) TaxID=945553 RepID=A0A0D2M7Q3_HYPSF|nr:hypothetical protein HYPSUDRAFT_56777 [Hypholoma sublateritium FD-334 SS-4]